MTYNPEKLISDASWIMAELMDVSYSKAQDTVREIVTSRQAEVAAMRKKKINRLADIIFPVLSSAGSDRNYDDNSVEAATRILDAGYREPAVVVESSENLKNYPLGTVIRDAEDVVCGSPDFPVTSTIWVTAEGDEYCPEDLSFPVTVIYNPDTDK